MIFSPFFFFSQFPLSFESVDYEIKILSDGRVMFVMTCSVTSPFKSHNENEMSNKTTQAISVKFGITNSSGAWKEVSSTWHVPDGENWKSVEGRVADRSTNQATVDALSVRGGAATGIADPNSGTREMRGVLYGLRYTGRFVSNAPVAKIPLSTPASEDTGNATDRRMGTLLVPLPVSFRGEGHQTNSTVTVRYAEGTDVQFVTDDSVQDHFASVVLGTIAFNVDRANSGGRYRERETVPNPCFIPNVKGFHFMGSSAESKTRDSNGDVLSFSGACGTNRYVAVVHFIQSFPLSVQDEVGDKTFVFSKEDKNSDRPGADVELHLPFRKMASHHSSYQRPDQSVPSYYAYGKITTVVSEKKTDHDLTRAKVYEFCIIVDVSGSTGCLMSGTGKTVLQGEKEMVRGVVCLLTITLRKMFKAGVINRYDAFVFRAFDFSHVVAPSDMSKEFWIFGSDLDVEDKDVAMFDAFVEAHLLKNCYSEDEPPAADASAIQQFVADLAAFLRRPCAPTGGTSFQSWSNVIVDPNYDPAEVKKRAVLAFKARAFEGLQGGPSYNSMDSYFFVMTDGGDNATSYERNLQKLRKTREAQNVVVQGHVQGVGAWVNAVTAQHVSTLIGGLDARACLSPSTSFAETAMELSQFTHYRGIIVLFTKWVYSSTQKVVLRPCPSASYNDPDQELAYMANNPAWDLVASSLSSSKSKPNIRGVAGTGLGQTRTGADGSVEFTNKEAMPGVEWTADHAEPKAHNFVLGITDPELIATLYSVASGTVLNKTRKQFLYCWVDGIQVNVRVRVFHGAKDADYAFADRVSNLLLEGFIDISGWNLKLAAAAAAASADGEEATNYEHHFRRRQALCDVMFPLNQPTPDGKTTVLSVINDPKIAPGSSPAFTEGDRVSALLCSKKRKFEDEEEEEEEVTRGDGSVKRPVPWSVTRSATRSVTRSVTRSSRSGDNKFETTGGDEPSGTTTTTTTSGHFMFLEKERKTLSEIYQSIKRRTAFALCTEIDKKFRLEAVTLSDQISSSIIAQLQMDEMWPTRSKDLCSKSFSLEHLFKDLGSILFGGSRENENFTKLVESDFNKQVVDAVLERLFPRH